jgi:hypothetical protein
LKKELLAEKHLSGGAKARLTEIANHSLSKATWSNYETARRMLARCGRDKKRTMELPLTEEDVLEFIDWMIHTRGLKHATITNYMAGIRQWHVSKGLEAPVLRTSLVKMVLAGKRNIEAMAISTKKMNRLPVTLTVMRLLKATLRDVDWEVEKKLGVWAISCIAFNGAFRIHELLARNEREFDPRFTLLSEDIRVAGSSEGRRIEVRVKWPKECKVGKSFTLDVFQTDGPTCPVRAWGKWAQVRLPAEEGMPAFRRLDGSPWTGRRFNEALRELLSPHLDYGRGGVWAHSFRSGLVSMMGAAGYSDEEIQAIGRWSSRAFEDYMKLPRTRRRQMALQISKLQQ